MHIEHAALCKPDGRSPLGLVLIAFDRLSHPSDEPHLLEPLPGKSQGQLRISAIADGCISLIADAVSA